MWILCLACTSRTPWKQCYENHGKRGARYRTPSVESRERHMWILLACKANKATLSNFNLISCIYNPGDRTRWSLRANNTTHCRKKQIYIFVLIDDHSHYMWSILLKEKGEAFDKFVRFKKIVEQETGATIKTLRTDRGGEFTSSEFRDFCEVSGIQRHLTAPYTP